MEKYCLANNIIDPSIQKGFLHNVSGTFEHIASLTSILNQAEDLSIPVNITFLDLKNAFGSIQHDLIMSMLQTLKVPDPIVAYLKSCYSQLVGYIHTNDWNTPPFQIQQLEGVFQGDTLSPIIFLISISPIFHLISDLPYKGYTFLRPLPNSEDLPPRGSTIYIYWNEPDSSEPEGWYRASISDYLPNGKTEIVYPDEAVEHIDLMSTRWTLARKNAKRFIATPDVPPPPPKAHPKVTKYVHGHEHKVKAFADDMTIITASKDDHQLALIEVDVACRSLGLYLKPSKCVSTSVHMQRFSLTKCHLPVVG